MRKAEVEKGTYATRAVSYAALIAYLVGIFSKSFMSSLMLSGNPQDLKTATLLDTLSSLAATIFVICGFVIASKYSWRYWPFRSLQILKKLDERQKVVRANIMEWSYRSFGVWAIATIFFNDLNVDKTRGYILWMMVGLFFFMPSLIAAHRKGA